MLSSGRIPVSFLYAAISLTVFMFCGIMMVLSFKAGAFAAATFFAALLCQALGCLLFAFFSCARAAIRICVRYK